MTNFITNAGKFTREGSIKVHCTAVMASGTESGGMLRFQVQDTGVGISPENVERLNHFDFFNKLDENSELNEIGTGIGLAISNTIAKVSACNIVPQPHYNDNEKSISDATCCCIVEISLLYYNIYKKMN